MVKHSRRNRYRTSDLQRYSRTQIEVKIRQAKFDALQKQRDEHGYNFCSVCERNDCLPLDCSHNIPVKKCLEDGMAEKAWDVNNITITGRRCHQIKDKLNLQFK